MRLNYKLLLGAGLGLFLTACGNGAQTQAKNDCPAGVPTAIFSQDIPQIRKHSFESSGQESVERLQLDTGNEIEILQSGCESIRQEFQVVLPIPMERVDEFDWVNMAADQLQYLSSFGPQYQAFTMWAQTIRNQHDAFQIGAPLEIQPGFTVEVDRVPSSDRTRLVITLAQQL